LEAVAASLVEVVASPAEVVASEATSVTAVARASFGRTGPKSLGQPSGNYRGGVQSDVLVDEWLTVPEAAERLGVDVGKVRQLIRDRRVIALRRGEPGRLELPAAFIRDGALLKGLPGLLTVLSDAGYDDEASVLWLFTPDDSLPGTPVQALAENRGTEVKRRAQALAF
jgi:excisionase family DNA binding protein